MGNILNALKIKCHQDRRMLPCLQSWHSFLGCVLSWVEGLNVDNLWISVDTYLCPVKSTKILLSHAGTIVEQCLLWDAHHAVDFFVDNIMMSLKQHPPYVDANTFWHAGSFSHAHISLAWHALVTAFSWKVVAALLCNDSSASVLEECEGLHRLKLLKVGSHFFSATETL